MCEDSLNLLNVKLQWKIGGSLFVGKKVLKFSIEKESSPNDIKSIKHISMNYIGHCAVGEQFNFLASKFLWELAVFKINKMNN